MKKLSLFSLQSNLIQIIPDQISELTNLKCIHLNYNKIERLPNAMLSMSNLQTIRISDNPKLELNDFHNKNIVAQLTQRGVGIYSKGSFD